MLRGATTLATIPSLLGFVAVALAGGPILRIAYGPRFASGGHIFAILAFGVAFGVAAGSCNFALIMTGHHRIVAVVSAITLVVAISGEIVGAHIAGMTGIAVASSGSTVFQNVLLTAMAKRRIGIWTQATLSPKKVRAFFVLRGLTEQVRGQLGNAGGAPCRSEQACDRGIRSRCAVSSGTRVEPRAGASKHATEVYGAGARSAREHGWSPVPERASMRPTLTRRVRR